MTIVVLVRGELDCFVEKLDRFYLAELRNGVFDHC